MVNCSWPKVLSQRKTRKINCPINCITNFKMKKHFVFLRWTFNILYYYYLFFETISLCCCSSLEHYKYWFNVNNVHCVFYAFFTLMVHFLDLKSLVSPHNNRLTQLRNYFPIANIVQTCSTIVHYSIDKLFVGWKWL